MSSPQIEATEKTSLERMREERSLTPLLRLLYRSFTILALRKLAERGYQGLGLAHVVMMAALEERGTRIITLAERTGTTKQFTGRLVQDLAQYGYVTTETDPTDKRATLVKATDKGYMFMQDSYEIKQEIEGDYESILGEERNRAFIEALELLYERHPECYLETPPNTLE